MSNKYIETEANDFPTIKQLDKFMIGHKGYIAGGVFKNIFNNEPFKDVDIFFESSIDQKQAEDYYKNNDEYSEWYNNGKVTAFKHLESGIIIELIKHTYADPFDMLELFDFTITKFAYYKRETEGEEDEEGNSLHWIFEEDEVVFDVEYMVTYDVNFFMHLHLKRLVINNEKGLSVNPYNTLNRTYRYAKYGYFPCLGTKRMLVEAIRNAKPINDNSFGKDFYEGID